MNRFDKAITRYYSGIGLGLSLSDLDPTKGIKKLGSAFESAIKDPKKIAAVIANPTLVLNAAAHQKAATAGMSAVEKNKIVQAALALIANPTLFQYGAEAKWAEENPEHAALVYTVALGAVTAGQAPALVKSVAGIGAAATGGYAKARFSGIDEEQAKQVAVNAATTSTVNTGINMLNGTGINFDPLVDIVGMDNIKAMLGVGPNSKIDPAIQNELNRVIGFMRAEGKTDSEIMGELINSDWFKKIAVSEAEQRTHASLYQSAYNQLLTMGYDPATAASIAMQFANKYAAQTAAQGVQNVINKGPMNFDPKLIFAAAAMILPFILLR